MSATSLVASTSSFLTNAWLVRWGKKSEETPVKGIKNTLFI